MFIEFGRRILGRGVSATSGDRERIDPAQPAVPPGGRPAPDGLPLFGLTPTEERYVMAERMTPHVYSNPRLTRIEGEIDAGRLAAAVDVLVARNAALRSGFTMDRAGRFWKYILPFGETALERVHLPGASLEEVNEYLRPMLMAKPDLTPPSLAFYHLITVAPDLHYFSFCNHHSISDGQSARLAMEEIFAHYRGEPLPDPAPGPQEVFPADWATSEPWVSQQRWWEEVLDGTPEPLDLPPDLDWRDGPEMLAFDRSLSAETAAALAAGAKALGVTEFTVAYAISLVLLSRLTGTTDVLTAFQSNGRRPLANAERSLGGYSNALILRAPLDPQQSFATYVTGLGERIRACVANELPPYHHIIAKTGVHPRFGINWFPAPPVFTIPGLTLSDASHDLRQSDYQLNFRFLRDGADRRLVVFYRARELGRARIEALTDQFEALAKALVAGHDRPMVDVRLADLLPLPSLQKSGDLPEEGASDDGAITADFLALARSQPDLPALVSVDVSLTYAALAERAGGVAASLAEAGVEETATVAILAQRNAPFVASMLGVSLRGGAFVVLDSAYPDERLEQMLIAARPAALLVSAADGLAERAAALAADAGLPLVQIDPERREAPKPVSAGPDSLAYILFTSGTTGKPKGIAVSHRPLRHFAGWQARHFAIGPGDRVTMLSGLGHDPLMRDIFTTLSSGATLIVPTQDDILSPGRLSRWVAEQQPSVCHITPPLGEVMLAGAAEGALNSLRLIFWGGDMLRPALVSRVREAAPGAVHVNFYGSTETPQAAAAFEIDKYPALGPVRAIPVGWGTEGHDVRVADGAGEALSQWEPGEIEVRSPFLALGGIEAGVVTAPAEAGLYRTGDRGFHRPDGAVQLAGRTDDQVKIRGFRIEPAEIGVVLEGHPRVSRAIVLADGESVRRLVAFTVDDLPPESRMAELAGFVSERLPAYMVPEQFISIERLPLLPNGKIDRPALRALISAEAARRPAASLSPPTAHEQQLIEAWQRVLGRDDITPADSLVSLGGDSLSFVNLYLATEDALGGVPDGWQVMTVGELCASGAKKDSFWRPTDSSMVTRSIAITLVVAAHLKLIPFSAGATTALFLVTGYLFGGLQLTTVFARRSVAPMLRMMVNLLIPLIVFSVLLYTWKTMTGRQPHISMLTFTSNFYDYRSGDAGGREIYLWYVHCMLQILCVVLLAAWLALRYGPPTLSLWRFSAGLFVAGIVLRFGIPALLQPGFFQHGTEHLSIWSYLPTTHLATVMLGVLIALADSEPRRRLLAPVLVVYALAQLHFFYGWGGIYLLVFGFLLLFARRVPLPRFLSSILLPISGASLFIYLMHYQFHGILVRFGITQPAIQVPVAILASIALWRLYSWLAAYVTRRVRRSAVVDDEPAPA